MKNVRFPYPLLNLCMVVLMVALTGESVPPPMLPLSEKVVFSSGDGKTLLIGYLFRPERNVRGPTPAVVMMHGRAGAYSSLAAGDYGAATLSQRHQQWGHIWADQGYLALLVDDFGPRGYPEGFSRFSYDQRPEEVNEVTVRPQDANAALRWLRARSDVVSEMILLQGWSNGGSATLATMASASDSRSPSQPQNVGFRAAIAFYPACGLKGKFDEGLVSYAPIQVFIGTADEEVSPRRCRDLVEKSRALNDNIEITIYPGATHDFDDPGRRRQKITANAEAKEDSIARSIAFFSAIVKAKGNKP